MCNFICPKCKSDHHTGCDTGLSTLMYFPPIYKGGKNINPDRNTTTSHITCLDCGKTQKVTN